MGDDAPPPPAARESAPEEADVPPWLLGDDTLSAPGMGDDAPPPPAARETAPEEADIPPWLVGDDTTSEAATEQADVPPWLVGDDTPPAAPEAREGSPPTPATTTPLDTGDMPDWLQDEGDERDSGESGLPSVSDTGLPSWLHGAEHDKEAPAAPAPSSFDLGLDDEAPRRGPEPAAPESDESSSFFGGADLPAFLRPAEPAAPAETEESRTVNWMQSLGIQEDESEVAVATTPEIHLPRPEFRRSNAQMEAASLLQRLVTQPYPEAAPAEEPAQQPLWQRIGVERMLYVALALALLAGAFMPSFVDGLGLQALTPNEVSVGAVVDEVDQLAADDVVLLAYEWDAQRISELAPLENAVTSHLIEQETGIVSVSTDPQGTILSFDLRDKLQAAGYRGQGFDYILLGYRPGGQIAALRSMAQDFGATLREDFKGEDASQGALATDMETRQPRLQSLDDLSMIVVMADQVEDVQGWMEQVHRVVADVPMVFLVPSEIAPIVQPYLQQDNVLHLAGKRDALTYLEQYSGTAAAAESAARSEIQLVYAVLVFTVLLVVGAVIGLIGRGRARG
jgi:hypothetical protein